MYGKGKGSVSLSSFEGLVADLMTLRNDDGNIVHKTWPHIRTLAETLLCKGLGIATAPRSIEAVHLLKLSATWPAVVASDALTALDGKGLPWLDHPTIVDGLEQCQRLRQEALSEHVREAVKGIQSGRLSELVEKARKARSVAHGPNHRYEDSAAEFVGTILDNFRQHAGYQDMLVQTIAIDMEGWVTGYDKSTGAAVEERAFDRGDFFEHILMCEQSVQAALGRQAVEGIGYTERTGADGATVRIDLRKGRREELHTPLDDTTYFVVRGRDWANRGMSFEPMVTDGSSKPHLRWYLVHSGLMIVFFLLLTCAI